MAESKDIFGRQDGSFGGAYKSSEGKLKLDGFDGLLLTNVQANYAVRTTRVFDLTTNNAYYVVGNAEGTGQIGSVVGPKAVASAAYETLGDPCNNKSLVFDFSNTVCKDSKTTVTNKFMRTLYGVVATSLGFQVTAQDMMINENFGFQFRSMGQTAAA